MKIRIKAQYTSIGLLWLLFMSWMLLALPLTVRSGDTISYNWNLDTYQSSISKIMDHQSDILELTGNYSDTFDAGRLSYYDPIENVWVEEDRVITYNANYSYSYNTTVSGYYTLDFTLDVYKITINYGTVAKVLWFALKKGTHALEYHMDDITHQYFYEVQYYQKTDRLLKKYDPITKELLNNSTETLEEYGTWHDEQEDNEEFLRDMNYIIEFSLPLIFTVQIFKASNNKWIAWADMFSDTYFIYEDVDKNLIYSVGDTNNLNTFTLIASEEFKGLIQPVAFSQSVTYEWYNKITNTSSSNVQMQQQPTDKTVAELTSDIEFTAPSSSIDGIQWDITYPNFPMNAWLGGTHVGLIDSYANSSPGNFFYGFNYQANVNETHLDYTLMLPKISDVEFYSEAQGLSLAIPHFSYFISSFGLKNLENSVLTVPSDVFLFKDNQGDVVAEMNMLNPVKKNYTLFDYPEEGDSSELPSYGSTISRFISSAYDYANNPSNIIRTVVGYLPFTIESELSEVRAINRASSLFSIEVQNYPVWSGNKLTHDPTLIAYLGAGTDTPYGIGEYLPQIIFGAIVAVVLIVVFRKRCKFNLN